MLTEKNESKSLRIGSVNEEGDEVLSSQASYNKQNINVSFDMLDKEYCSTHVEEVQSAMTAFLARLNAELAECGLPLVVTK